MEIALDFFLECLVLFMILIFLKLSSHDFSTFSQSHTQTSLLFHSITALRNIIVRRGHSIYQARTHETNLFLHFCLK